MTVTADREAPKTLYSVRLESQTDSHWRTMTIEAESAALARALALRTERDLVGFSLLPPEPVEPEQPDLTDDETEQDAEVIAQWLNARDEYELELQHYPSRREAAEKALAGLEARYEFDETGKVVEREKLGKNPVAAHPRARAHLHAHHQTKPYRVVSVDPVLPNTAQIVDGLKRLHQNDAAWAKTLEAMKAAGLPIAAVTGALAGLSWQAQIDGSSPWVWSSAAIQCSLHTAYTFNNDTHDFFNDASATEVTGTGYTANGVTLASKTSTYDTATDQIRLDAADVSLTSSTISATDAVLWVNTAGASSTDPILGNVDFGGTVSTTAGTFQITWDATGIFVFDVT